MPLLTARFELPIDAACLLQLPDGTVADFQTTHNGFNAIVKLLPSGSWRHKGKDDTNWTTSICAIEVTLIRDDPDDVPEVIQQPDGMRDLTQQGEFLLSRLDDYKSAAREISNKVLDFFRYCLFTPSVRKIVRWDQALATPVWYNARGENLGPSRVIVAQPIPGVSRELGVQKFTEDRIPDLARYLNASDEPPLELALLSDAQTAWFEDSLRRTVLELAICTEVMVKRCFFAAASPAGAAFDYLEDRSKVSVRVLDLLGPIADEAFSRSYRTEFPEHFRRIDLLFRCRNKIAHRGELTYRDDSGQTHQATSAEVAEWWASVAHLRTWLGSL